MTRIRSFFISIFLCIGVLISSCARTNSPVSPIGDFPLSKGTTWTYSVTEYQPAQNDSTKTISGQSVYEDTVVDTQTVGSFFIAHVQRTIRLTQSESGWITTTGAGILEWWYVLDGLKVYESRQPLDVNNIQPDSLLLDLDFPLELGKTWCYTTGALKGGIVGNCLDASKVSVDELKSVTSRAARFQNCVQVIYWSNGGNTYRQFCPRVGFMNVKFDHSGTRFGFEQTLTKYSPGESGSLSTFQLITLLLAAAWLLLVAVRFRRSTLVLIIGLVVLSLFTLAEGLLGNVSAADLGLDVPAAWLTTLLYALAGLAVLLAYSPLADRIASRFFPKPPDLGAFKPVQRSWLNLVIGIVVAWLLGGFLEELIARGIILNSIEALLAPALGTIVAAIIAILVSAAGAGVMHAYQGPRAMLIIGQLSVLFGVLFFLSGHNLWVVIICHGLYDTIAFIRFALKKSRYSNQ